MASVDTSDKVPARLLQVRVAYSPAPRGVDEVTLQLPAGTTLADALQASGLLVRHGLVLDDALGVGIWAKAKPLDTVLRDNDRVEVWRTLKVDPKEARRQRYRKQSPKASGR
jgi:putative ubiquitin-RnfH superfamily antitoxin RatB of RatAB toxin-antitoxin module